MNLYEIQVGYREAIEELVNMEGELTPELQERLEISQDQLQDKAQGYALVILDQKSNVEKIDQEIKRLQARKSKFKKVEERLKDQISMAMNLFDVKKIETPKVTLSFRKSTSVQIDGDIQKDFCTEKVTLTPDKKKIKEALVAGEAVLNAELVEKQSLQIK